MDTSSDTLSPAYLMSLLDRLEHLDDGAQALILLVERLGDRLPDDHATEVAALRFTARAVAEGIARAVGTARRIGGG